MIWTTEYKYSFRCRAACTGLRVYRESDYIRSSDEYMRLATGQSGQALEDAQTA